ncbi:hypothetical protein [Variovorax paradoxus]|uniref:hypothetical protein n=1 Tax=Variovorax paradoxus TaxID=34073 RepID=UPI003ECC7FE5
MAKKSLKLCPLAQHIVNMLAESGRPGHGPTYACSKAHELHGRTTNDVLVWASHQLDSSNRGCLADVIGKASGWNIDPADLVAAARVEKALGGLPVLNLQELLA